MFKLVAALRKPSKQKIPDIRGCGARMRSVDAERGCGARAGFGLDFVLFLNLGLEGVVRAGPGALK